MAERQRHGSGTPSTLAPGASTPGSGTPAEESYPGERYGLPEKGPGSVAGIGSRVVALLIDWLLCELIAVAAFHTEYLTIAVFAVETYLLTALTGFTVGKRLLSIRVVRIDGHPVGFLRGLVRLVLFLCVVPPLVYDSDARGLHDRGAKTIVIRV